MVQPEITTSGEEMQDWVREEDGETDWGLEERMVRGGAWAAVS